METLISPSLLSANFLDLKSDIEMINNSEADWLHLDIMMAYLCPIFLLVFQLLTHWQRNVRNRLTYIL